MIQSYIKEIEDLRSVHTHAHLFIFFLIISGLILF